MIGFPGERVNGINKLKTVFSGNRSVYWCKLNYSPMLKDFNCVFSFQGFLTEQGTTTRNIIVSCSVCDTFKDGVNLYYIL